MICYPRLFISNKMEEDMMGGECGIYGREEKYVQ